MVVVRPLSIIVVVIVAVVSTEGRFRRFRFSPIGAEPGPAFRKVPDRRVEEQVGGGEQGDLLKSSISCYDITRIPQHIIIVYISLYIYIYIYIS